MNFYWSLGAVILGQAICTAIGYNPYQSFIILVLTMGLYTITQIIIKIVQMWNSVK